MIACLSPESLASNNVMDEVSYALEEGKLVVPIRLRPCVIPFRLRRLQHVDFAETDYEAAFSQLLKSLRAGSPSQPVGSAATASTDDERHEPRAQTSRNEESREQRARKAGPPVATPTKLSPTLLMGSGALVALLILFGYQSWKASAPTNPPVRVVTPDPTPPSPTPQPTDPPPTVPKPTAPKDPGVAGDVGPAPKRRPSEPVDQPGPVAQPSVPPNAATAPGGDSVTKPPVESFAPGTWGGTLTFAGAASPISIEFCEDTSLRLSSRLGDRAFGKWIATSANAVRVDARHRDLGAFTCTLAGTGSSLGGPCEANGLSAGVIGLSTFAAPVKTTPSVGVALDGALCEQRSFAKLPTPGAESPEQTRRRWEAFLQSIRK